MLSKLNKLWERMNIPIYLKLTLIYAFIFSLMIVISSTATFKIMKYLGWQNFKEEVRDTSREIANYIKAGKALDKSLLQEIDLRGPVDFRIYNRAGDLVLSNDWHVLHSKKGQHRLEINMKSNLGSISVWRDSSGEKKALYLNRKIEYNNQLFYLQVDFPLRGRDSIFNTLLLILSITSIIGILSSIVVGNYIAKKMLRPIGEITATAQKITINDLDKRIDTSGADDELKKLALTFNNMIDRLQASIEKQKQFVSDASHELRTPISVIQGYIDLLDRWGKEDKEVLEEAIEAIQAETTSMKKLLEQLLFLARSDKGQYKFEHKTFDLSELIAEVYQEFELIDDEHEITLAQNDQVEIRGDAKAIKQMLRIIIDNSIKYTESGGRITITSQQRREEEQVRIVIKDTGRGIGKEELDRIFDRFYRVDESRTSKTGGAGLGLSIAKWIVESQQGRIEANSELNKGTEIIITLPTC
ncbi:sensor histidine kinase [Acetohalobium arabaticum]|uniref:histidine kinase n=1 Tax=Acetohalobium arabaticum (strain ATCC 49924 / DSM 5501 / Z-7288) TaxID=574087 RepID=D9QSF2_ACEAZ|nr:ATP-binding protein [Acetohalobium arabaticum]ADL13415.1 integral membrane sensor signal transduction histidine kinase [Acetohalobium arabaticum DSM 5501]